MKKLLILLFILSSPIIYADQHPSDTCDPKNKSFKTGEKISYKIAFKWGALWLSAGEASFTLEDAKYNNKDVFHAIGFGQTFKSYDWFFKVRDKYESYIDKETMLPYKFVRDVNEGDYSFYQNVTFKHQDHKATSLKGTFDIPNCTQDVLSAIYFSRCIDWSKYKVNDTVPITIFLDDIVYPLYIRYLGKEKVTVKSGTYNCVKFKPLLIDGTIFKGGEKMTVYVTDDANKIPVLVTSPILIGEIRAELTTTSGLTNALSSKIK